MEKIESEIAEGKLGIARDRLHGLVLSFPCDMQLRSRLGDVYSKQGYPIEAGRFWFLDEDLTDEKRAAMEKWAGVVVPLPPDDGKVIDMRRA